jgi:hypothetical protein
MDPDGAGVFRLFGSNRTGSNSRKTCVTAKTSFQSGVVAATDSFTSDLASWTNSRTVSKNDANTQRGRSTLAFSSRSSIDNPFTQAGKPIVDA